jgi:uncharacterized protein (DUF608 family)
MKKGRRAFLETAVAAGAAVASTTTLPRAEAQQEPPTSATDVKRPAPKSRQSSRQFNGPYSDQFLNRVAFPVGGIGAGMFCIEGTGAVSHMSVRNSIQVFNEPCMFAALAFKGKEGKARVIEGPVPAWKVFGNPGAGNGAAGTSYGFPRFAEASFLARFPFGMVTLGDPAMGVSVEIAAWSPFIPGDADNSSLPVGALEYTFRNTSGKKIEAVFSYHAKNFMAAGNEGNTILPTKNGFVLHQDGSEKKPFDQGDFVVFVDDDRAVVDHCWFKGGWWDALTLAWRNVLDCVLMDNPPVKGVCPGGSLFVPLALAPGGAKTIRVMMAWYVPLTELRVGENPEGTETQTDKDSVARMPCSATRTHVPWYTGKFKTIEEVSDFWRGNYGELRKRSALFRDSFYDTTLPPEVVEAAAANLTILKTPTVLRATCGRLWCWEGCGDSGGCCHGSCTHVWNYAQAIPHLFPDLERSLRQTEFNESQVESGNQTFRSFLPIRPIKTEGWPASDGQLGGIMKVYREWRISGDNDWLRSLWPKVKKSIDYCIKKWDPRGIGLLEERHHNTYDIEYWGPDGHCSSFYLGALAAAAEMGDALGDDVSRYRTLLDKGKAALESELFNGEYFYQKVVWEGLDEKYTPLDVSSNGSGYQQVVDLLNRQGPKYQYGTGCLSDGVLGFWIARVCGLGEIIDRTKVKSHLAAIYKYNLKHDLSEHSNPQRPSYALGKEGGLLLCTWPRGGALALPFVYSNEVWTGIEYQVASHLMLEGMVREGLDIVRTARARYDGRVRNPFNEYECGHWYARAMSSYGLIQGLTGARYDAIDRTLFIDSKVGPNFRSFLSTATGYGTVGLKAGKPFLEVKSGVIDVQKTVVSGKEMTLEKR